MWHIAFRTYLCFLNLKLLGHYLTSKRFAWVFCLYSTASSWNRLVWIHLHRNLCSLNTTMCWVLYYSFTVKVNLDFDFGQRQQGSKKSAILPSSVVFTMEKLRSRMNQQSCYWNTLIVSWGTLVSRLWIWAPFAWTNCLLMGGRDHQTFPLLHFHTLHYSLIPISQSTTSVDTPCVPRGVYCVIYNMHLFYQCALLHS